MLVICPNNSAGSINLPIPMIPDAKRPGAGPHIVMPRSISVDIFFWVAGLSNIFASIAGAMIIGAVVAIAVVVRGSSARPNANFAMV